jgi:hypothetical protein
MSRRKSEITGYMNERDFPHLVELELPAGGFRDKSQELESFHRERGIAIRRGRGRHEAEQLVLTSKGESDARTSVSAQIWLTR